MNEPIYAGQAAPRPKTSNAAVWSLVLGILSISCLWILGSIPAIILGVMGMKKADANPAFVGGKGISLAGLICGCVGIIAGLFPIAVAASFVLPGVQGVKERAEQTREVSHMRQALLGMNIYAADNEGLFPEKLTDLIPSYIDDDRVIRSFESKDVKGDLFLYRSGLNTLDTATGPILLSPKTFRGGKRVVGFVGGHVMVMGPDKLVGIVEKFE